MREEREGGYARGEGERERGEGQQVGELEGVDTY